MDLTSSIIGVVILIFFLMPVYFINRSNKNRKARLRNKLETLARDENITLTYSDVWDESAIAIDTESGIIIYISESSGDDLKHIIRRDEIKSVRTVPASDLNDSSDKEPLNEGRLSIIISFVQKGRPDLAIDFHTRGFGKISEKEKKLFSNWSAVLKGFVSGQNHK